MKSKTNATSPSATAEFPPAPVAWIGLDWGHHTHAFALEDQSGQHEEGTLEHSSETLHTWLSELQERWQARLVAVAIEANRGAVIQALHP